MIGTSRARQNEIGGWVGLLGTVGFLFGVGVFIYQMYLWLRLGQWVPMPLSTVLVWFGFDYSSTTHIAWMGVQKLVVWGLDLPLSVMSILTGFAIGYFVGELVASVRDLGRKDIS